MVDKREGERMIKVLEELRKERETEFEFADEKIASNLYLVSFSHALRAIKGIEDKEKLHMKWIEENEWLKEETECCSEVGTLAFDNIKEKVDLTRRSCDAFFYDFAGERKSYLAEFKKADKATLLKFLEGKKAKDAILPKVQESLQLIENELEFGGKMEHRELIENTHFFLVYGGKNNVASRRSIVMPGKAVVDRDTRGKQKKAAHLETNNDKQEYQIYEQFAREIEKLGLADCDKEEFPGDALPECKKVKGYGKRRRFSVFSARDFSEILQAGYFDDWKWGAYKEYLAP